MTTMMKERLGSVDVAELVRRAADGDRQAWERLVDQFARLIWSITADFKLAESDAGDVAQTTWLRLLEHIDRIQYPDRVGSWLAATARNECLRSLAARKRVVLSDDDVELGGAVTHGPEVDERLLAHERDQTVGRRCPVCPGGGSACSKCSWPIRRPPTPTSQMSSSYPSEASARPGDDAWPGYASCCRPPDPNVAASTHRPPEPSTSGKASRTSAIRSGTNSSTAFGLSAASRPERPRECRFPASVGPAWPVRRQPPRAAVRDQRAPGTAARPPGTPRHSPGPCVRRIVRPPASHAGP